MKSLIMKPNTDTNIIKKILQIKGLTTFLLHFLAHKDLLLEFFNWLEEKGIYKK